MQQHPRERRQVDWIGVRDVQFSTFEVKVSRPFLSMSPRNEPSQSLFAIAIEFWPETSPRAEMYSFLQDLILRNIAAIKWRIQIRMLQPPLNASFVETAESWIETLCPMTIT